MATISQAIELALAHHGAGRPDLAEEICRRILDVEPDHPHALHVLGVIAHARGQHDVAVAQIRRAIRLKGDEAIFHDSLGIVLRRLGKLDEAVACYRRALELRPDYARALNNLGTALDECGNPDEALGCYRRALELRPGLAEAHYNLGNAWKHLGELEEAVASYTRALALNPSLSAVRSNLLCALRYCPGVTLADLGAACADYEQWHAAPLRAEWRPHDDSADPERALLVGFVSPRLGRGPVGAFLARTLENVDRGRYRVACYADGPRADDDVAARLHAVSALWRDVAGMSDEQLAARVRADRVDVLFAANLTDLLRRLWHERCRSVEPTCPASS